MDEMSITTLTEQACARGCEHDGGQADEETRVSKAVNGDLDAFNELVLNYQDMAYNHAYALIGDHDIAEDATQESFIKAYKAITRFRNGSFRAWLLKIVTNTSYDMLRQSRRRQTVSIYPEDEYGEERDDPAWLTDPNASVQDIVEQEDEAQQLYRMIAELPEIYRNAITLVDVHELDYAEAAQILGIPKGTVKSRLARARLQMMARLRMGKRGKV